MSKKYTFFTIWLLIFQLLMGATEILINTQEGETFVLEIDLEESLSSVQERVDALRDGQTEGFLIEMPSEESYLALKPKANKQGGYLGYPRNYHVAVTAKEKIDIAYIITCLANKSWLSLGPEKKYLDQAGVRINHIHPLRFLMTVFCDEKLKVGIRNIQGKWLIWDQFVDGLKKSFATEAKINNIKDEFITDFAQKVGVNVDVIYASIKNEQWSNFIDLLITHVPREGGDYDRYNY